MAFNPRTAFVARDFGRLAYQVIEGGSAGHVLWCQDSIQHLDLLWTDESIVEAYRSLIPLGLTSIVCQPRGVGLSDAIDRASSVDERAADLVAILDAEGVSSATLVSTASTAQQVALVSAQYPERVKGIVMIGPGYVGPRIAPDEGGWTPARARECIDAHERAFREWGSGHILPIWDAGLVTPYNQRLIAMSERCSIPSPELARLIIEGWIAQDSRAVWPQVQSPTRVLEIVGGLWGGAPAVADAIPGAELVRLPPSQPGDAIGQVWADYVRHVAEVALGDGVAPSGPERVLATILFTDIVGSTDLLARVGDEEWSRLLERHDQLLSRHVIRYGGKVVSGTGDGALCEFASPGAAVECAQATCEAAREELGIELRAGVHTGEISRRAGDLAGLAVHIGSRVCSAAGASEVFVSRTVRDLVGGSDLSFSSRGEHQLKGVPGTWELFAVGEEDAPPISLRAPRRPGVADRAMIELSRRAPGALRRVNRVATAAQKRRYGRRPTG